MVAESEQPASLLGLVGGASVISSLCCLPPVIMVLFGLSSISAAAAFGDSLYFGKPHPPIYDLARRRLAALGKQVETAGILAIGDGIHTDISGAMGEDIDSLFISGGLAAKETKTNGQPDPDALDAYLNKEMANPTFTIGHLR